MTAHAHHGLTAGQLAAALERNDDERISTWAANVERRACAKQINRGRAYDRLLEPFLEVGLVIKRGGRYQPTALGAHVFDPDDTERTA